MKLSSKEILRRLGAGESISAVCQAAGISRGDFDAWWRQETASRVPDLAGRRRVEVKKAVRVLRDRWGIPHIQAESDADLFFGFGYAMAQDRLFQLDFLRRKGAGRLAEVLGPRGETLEVLTRTTGFKSILELDVLARTVGLRRIAEEEWSRLPAESQALLQAFSAGINAHMEECHDRLPIEFDLLDYHPEPWTPIDSVTIEVEFRWYLTGRFPIIVMPELVKRQVGDGPLYQAYLHREFDDECILPAGSYDRSWQGSEALGPARDRGGASGIHGPMLAKRGMGPGQSSSQASREDATGSNNWVVAGRRSASGKPLVGSDPHIAFESVSCWYEVHLSGGSFNVAGMAYAGMPAVMFGRNEKVAWGCTNNILSQRDLYLEKTDPGHPNCFLHDGKWEPGRELEEVIHIKDGTSLKTTVRFSRNGPIVTDILPPPARTQEAVSLKWLGAYQGGWLTALLAMNRASSRDAFREAMRPWHVPAFSIVYADVSGAIGYQAAGRVPIRSIRERGYRPGWEAEHQWQGLMPFEAMPHSLDPERGWLATANNRVAPEDFPYNLAGCWNECLRATRIRQLFEAREQFSRADLAAMHQDALSLRATAALPNLLQALAASPLARVQEAMAHLRNWDGQMRPESVGATLFELFFTHFQKRIVQERFDPATAALVAGGAHGLAALLLQEDAVGWFGPGGRERAIHDAFESAVNWLKDNVSYEMGDWTWGKLHTIPLRHVLSGRGDLGTLLDQLGGPVRGTSVTICNTGSGGPRYEAKMGAGYRLIADLAETGLHAIDAQSESGHPGSPHYGDQLTEWVEGKYHYLPLERGEVEKAAVTTLTLEAAG